MLAFYNQSTNLLQRRALQNLAIVHGRSAIFAHFERFLKIDMAVDEINEKIINNEALIPNLLD